MDKGRFQWGFVGKCRFQWGFVGKSRFQWGCAIKADFSGAVRAKLYFCRGRCAKVDLHCMWGCACKGRIMRSSAGEYRIGGQMQGCILSCLPTTSLLLHNLIYCYMLICLLC